MLRRSASEGRLNMDNYCTCSGTTSFALVFDDDGGFDWKCKECSKVRKREYNLVTELPETDCPIEVEIEQEHKDFSFPNIIDRFRWMVCLLPVVQKVVFSKNGK